MKVKDLTHLALKTLESIDGFKAESEWLVALSLGISRGEVYSNQEVFKGKQKIFNKALKKRMAGEPLSYIFNSACFYGYDFYVNKHTLIPRPETEELVNEALKHISEDSTVLDIGTGSGAIAVTIQKESNAKVTAVDISNKALKVAKKNAKKNDVKVEFIHSNIFSKLKERMFDVIISNPPYITNEAYLGLDKTVKDFEPKLALVGGDDGLDFYKEIVKNAHKYLKNNGKIFFEIGYDQGEAVKTLLTESGYKNVTLKKDLYKNDRIVYAEKGE